MRLRAVDRFIINMEDWVFTKITKISEYSVNMVGAESFTFSTTKKKTASQIREDSLFVLRRDALFSPAYNIPSLS